jgi:hypothetical protein
VALGYEDSASVQCGRTEVERWDCDAVKAHADLGRYHLEPHKSYIISKIRM